MRPRIETQVRSILGWPTETVLIDYCGHEDAHTVLCFVPGNPGCVGWYIPFLEQLVTKLGVGFAACGVSYAGHGGTPDQRNVEQWEHDDKSDRNTRIPWTVNGQIDHKIAWLDMILKEFPRNSSEEEDTPRIVFITHSIGAHMVQRLCILRPDILQRTCLIIHLMPFMRMNAPQPQQWFLSRVAQSPSAVLAVGRGLSRIFGSVLPATWQSLMLRDSVPDEKDRQLAQSLISQPAFVRNFFELGCEEIRHVPEQPDAWALQRIARHCPTEILFCGGPDHWAPPFHMDDIKELQQHGLVPNNVHCTYLEPLRHAFVVVPQMVPVVLDYCLQRIQMGTTQDEAKPRLLSRL